MTKNIPTDFLDLFKKASFAHLATVMPNGAPQVSPVWVDFDGKYVVVNSAVGRQKDLNIHRDERVAIEVQDCEDPYRFLLVRGRVAEITVSGAEEHINTLAIRYTGEDYKWYIPGQVRVIYKIEPLHVTTSN